MKSNRNIQEENDNQAGRDEQLDSIDTQDVVIDQTPFENLPTQTTNASSAAPKPPMTSETRTGANAVSGSLVEGTKANATVREGATTPAQDEKIVLVATALLKPHPRNAEVYGDEPDDPELQKSISDHSVLEPLIAGEDYTLAAGHRRLRAAKAVGLTHVPVVIRRFKSEDEHLAALLDTNQQRKKTNEMLGREAVLRLVIEKKLGKIRQKEANSSQKDEALAGGDKTQKGKKGKARDKTGDQLGISGPTVDHLVATVKAIDDLEKKGKTTEAGNLRKTLNGKSINAGYNEAVNRGYIKTATPKKFEDSAATTTEKQTTPVQAAPNGQASPDDTADGFPAIKTHDNAMKAMGQLIAYVEDLDATMQYQGRRDEWKDSMQGLAGALKDAGISES